MTSTKPYACFLNLDFMFINEKSVPLSNTYTYYTISLFKCLSEGVEYVEEIQEEIVSDLEAQGNYRVDRIQREKGLNTWEYRIGL